VVFSLFSGCATTRPAQAGLCPQCRPAAIIATSNETREAEASRA
jgi:hypothetical protein